MAPTYSIAPAIPPKESTSSTPSELKDSGTRQNFSTGAVRDAQENKGMFHLLPYVAVFLLARIYEMGAKKYAARNWEKGMPISRYIDSAQRHLAKYMIGMRDEPHLSMAAWNIIGALHTAVQVYLGRLPAEFNDLPNHVGESAWKDQPYWNGNETQAEPFPQTWAAPPLSPNEVSSVKGFLGL